MTCTAPTVCERAVRKRIREAIQIAKHIRASAGDSVDADGPGYLFTPQPTSGCALSQQDFQTLLQCIDGPIRLILRNNQRWTQTDRVLSATENEKTTLKCEQLELVRRSGARSFVC